MNIGLFQKQSIPSTERISIAQEGGGGEKCLKVFEGEGRHADVSFSKGLHFVKNHVLRDLPSKIYVVPYYLAYRHTAFKDLYVG